MTHDDLHELIPALCGIANDAAHTIMEVYSTDFSAKIKSDNSPVTEADQRANDLIVERLSILTPHIPVISEEAEKPHIDTVAPFWLVDPLDGTKSFIARDGQFTVNIGLIINKAPALGVMHLPAAGDLYWGIVGKGAYKQPAECDEAQPIAVREPSKEGYDIVMSKVYRSPKLEDWTKDYPIRRRVQAGSALKFCRVAEARADIYPRLGPTMEWDTAAGHAIVEAAGGYVTDLSGEPLRYGKEGYLNPAFVASGTAILRKQRI